MPDPNPPSDPNAPPVGEAQARAMLGASEPTHDLTPDELAAASSATRKMTNATGGGAGLWQPPSVEEAEQLFPNYEVISLLGRGGMGAVYKARQIALDRFVAIKLLPLEISADMDFADRFRREARAMAKLNHPNIISVYDFGQTSEGHLFFVMEFVEGANLHAIIRAQELSADQALWLSGQVCTALAYAHGKGVVHRDIKPANVMVDTEGNAKVADFGLARLTDVNTEQLGHTQTGTVMGTPDYMAPEQMRGMNVDHRADIYSLGVMLYEMLCREVPRGIFSPPSVRTGCDGRIDSIVVKAMQSEPDRRYQSTQEMGSDVDTIRAAMVQPSPSMVAAVGTPRRDVRARAVTSSEGGRGAALPGQPARESRSGLWIGLAAAVLVLGALAFILMQPAKPKKPVAKTKPVPESVEKPTATKASTAALEPGAIKLWSTEAEVPKFPNISWENNAVRLDNKATLSYDREPAKNLRASASIRMNPDATNPSLMLRRTGRDNYLRVSVAPREQRAYVTGWHTGAAAFVTHGELVLPRKYGPDEWLGLSVEFIDTQLRVFADGKLLATYTDTALIAPGLVALYGEGNCYFRDIVFVPLDKPGASPALATAAIEPGANKLWDSAEKLPKLSGVSWEGNALKLDQKASLKLDTPAARDLRFSASVRIASGGRDASLACRRSGKGNAYVVEIEHTHLRLNRVESGNYTNLATERLPKRLGPDDWMSFEVEAIDDQLRVMADGKLLATATDATLREPGGLTIYGDANCYFRDIVYVPLDKAGASLPAASATLEPGAIKLWNTEAKVAALPKNLRAHWENGVLVTDDSQSLTHDLKSRDAIIRGAIRRVTGRSHAYIGLRAGEYESGRTQPCYRLQPDFENNVVQLHCQTGEKLVFLQNWPMPASKTDPGWLQLELRAVGDTLTAIVEGDTLGTFRDTTLTQPGGAIIYGTNGSAFRDIVYVPLDKPGASSPPNSNSAEKWNDWIAEQRARGALDRFGFDDDGTAVRHRQGAPMFWHPRVNRDGAVRATWRLSSDIPPTGSRAAIFIRNPQEGGSYRISLDESRTSVTLITVDADRKPKTKGLSQWLFPAGFSRTAEHTLEVRAVGDTMTVSLDGKALGSFSDTTHAAGGFGFFAEKGAAIGKVESVSFDGAQRTAQPAAAKQTIDLVASLDLVKDRLRAEGLAGSNVWQRGTDGSLAFDGSDGKAGKIAAPVALNGLRDYEIEVGVPAKTDRYVTLDFPISATNQATLDFKLGEAIEIGADENGKRLKIGDWPQGAGGPPWKVAGRVKLAADGINGTLTATVNGLPAGEWRGPLGKLGKPTEAHPEFPDQLVPAIFVFKGSRAHSSWTLRVFEGEAKVLRPAAGASAPPQGSVPGEKWEDLIKAGGWPAPWSIESGVLSRPAKTMARRQWNDPVRDGAWRVTRRWDGGWFDLQLGLRSSGQRGLRLHFVELPQPDVIQLHIGRDDGTKLAFGRTKKRYQKGDIITVEFRAVGNQVTGSIDGEVVVTAQDEIPAAGKRDIWTNYGDAPAIHRVEFLNLDAAK